MLKKLAKILKIFLKVLDTPFKIFFKRSFLIWFKNLIEDDAYISLEINKKKDKIHLFNPSYLTNWLYEDFFSKEPETIEWIDNFEKDKDIIFWDIGANLGIYSIYAASIYKKIKVISFEPSTSNLRILSRNIYINKPLTSRPANSEKYIVCKGFLYSKVDSFYPFIHRAFEKMLAPTKTPASILRFLTVPVNNLFVTKLEEYNAIFGQQQVENIYQTIMLIENKHNQEKIDTMIKNNVQKSIQWCTRYQIPYNILLPPLEETIFK